MGSLLSAFVMALSLDQVRSDPRLATDPAAIEALVHDADAMPAGVERAEAWMFAANAYAQRLGRPADAVPLYRRVAADPADAVLAHAALDAVVELHLDEGDLAAARADLALLPDARVGAIVQRAERRHYLHIAAILTLAATLALAFRGRRKPVLNVRRYVPIALAFSTFVALGGSLLATAFSAGTARPFIGFGVALFPLIVMAMIWRKGPPSLRAAACGVSVLAAAFLVLERYGQLDGLGL